MKLTSAPNRVGFALAAALAAMPITHAAAQSTETAFPSVLSAQSLNLHNVRPAFEQAPEELSMLVMMMRSCIDTNGITMSNDSKTLMVRDGDDVFYLSGAGQTGISVSHDGIDYADPAAIGNVDVVSVGDVGGTHEIVSPADSVFIRGIKAAFSSSACRDLGR